MSSEATTFSVGNVTVGGNRTVVIAEAGVNHLGRMDYAEELVKTASRAGADIVKFQTYKADKLSTRDAPRFWDWEGEHDEGGSQHDSYSILDSFEREQYEELVALCEKYEVEFMSTPFDNDAVDMLVEIGSHAFKIASCDVTNIPFLKYVGATNLPIFLSTGASDIDEIRSAVHAIESAGDSPVCIMHCTLCYPTDPKDSNLTAIHDIATHFPGHVLGLSDHTLGTIVPAASILFGVKAIEKHYTFDKTLPDSADHWLSLNEDELAQMVRDVRELEVALGVGKKIKLECEMPAHNFARRSVVAAAAIPAGTTITGDMVTQKRPGTGLAPVFTERFIGATAARDIEPDELLQLTDIES